MSLDYLTEKLQKKNGGKQRYSSVFHFHSSTNRNHYDTIHTNKQPTKIHLNTKPFRFSHFFSLSQSDFIEGIHLKPWHWRPPNLHLSPRWFLFLRKHHPPPFFFSFNGNSPPSFRFFGRWIFYGSRSKITSFVCSFSLYLLWLHTLHSHVCYGFS